MLFKHIDVINGKVIRKLIEKSATQHSKIKALYERYKQESQGTPILTRKYKIGDVEQKDKINNKLANDFVGEIVDMKVGFFCGVPISYTLDKTSYEVEQKETIPSKVKSLFQKDGEAKKTVLSNKYQQNLDIINNFNKRNSISDLDLETAKRETACGYTGRLLYIDLIDGKPAERIKLIDPWECIFVGESIEEPEYAIRYFDVISYNASGEEIKKSKAEVYSSSKIEYYEQNENKEYVFKGDISHVWGASPLFGFANNDERLGDCNKVLTLIDAYDRALSDINSELEQFRLAYLKVIGASIDDKEIKKAQKTGAFSLPGDGADIDFITKHLDDLINEHHLDRLEKNIYRFSATPNMNDISFGGNLTGVAMKYKFRPFEDKSQRSELKFKKSLRSQYEKLSKVWADRGIQIDPMDMDFIFTRNYPQNIPEEIQMLRDSKGIVSEETRFGLVSFIEDPEKEMEKLKDEEQENLDNFVARNEALKETSDNQSQDNQDQPEDETRNAISNQAK
jgi:SPP1 family phage portal protein